MAKSMSLVENPILWQQDGEILNSRADCIKNHIHLQASFMFTVTINANHISPELDNVRVPEGLNVVVHTEGS